MKTLHEIESAAMQLDPQELSVLVNRLVANLDKLDDLLLPDLDPRWIAICEKRLEDLTAGLTQPLDGESVMREMRELANR